ncbi:hypothetical protein ACFLRO_02100 [Bacteroidota bacterium]
MGYARRISAILVLGLLTAAVMPVDGIAQDAHEEESVEGSSVFRVGRWANWLFRSYLQDETDDASTLGIELESYIGLGGYEAKNISYFEVNQYPRAIPGQPPGNSVGGLEAADGVNDLLSAFWISKKGPHHGKHHFAPGFAMQFPTATDATLGSGKWSIGPSFDYEYDGGRLFTGAIALQIWSFAGESDRKDVSMLMIKPFIYYTVVGQWQLVYVPYGVSVYWNKPEGEKMYLPLGGGVQRGIRLGSGSMQLNLAAQFFKNVVRPTKGTVYDLRFLVELSF